MYGEGHIFSSPPEGTVIPPVGWLGWCFPFGLPIRALSLGALVEKEMLGSIDFCARAATTVRETKQETAVTK